MHGRNFETDGETQGALMMTTEGALMVDYNARYIPIFKGKRKSPGIVDQQTGLFHPRAEYTDIELASLCRWLNERSNNYPSQIVLRDY